jgi:hypothetical protein
MSNVAKRYVDGVSGSRRRRRRLEPGVKIHKGTIVPSWANRASR